MSITETLLLNETDWVFNSPCAYHQGSIQERHRGTVRKVLNAIMTEQVLSDQSLNTVICEVCWARASTANTAPIPTEKAGGEPAPITISSHSTGANLRLPINLERKKNH